MKEFALAVEADLAEQEGTADEEFIPFRIGDREMKAYHPNDTQLAFMMAALGRGQIEGQRFGSILNIMYETLEPADKDWLESAMLRRGSGVTMELVEKVFEWLTEQWFARPTQPQSASARSEPTTGP